MEILNMFALWDWTWCAMEHVHLLPFLVQETLPHPIVALIVLAALDPTSSLALVPWLAVQFFHFGKLVQEVIVMMPQ